MISSENKKKWNICLKELESTFSTNIFKQKIQPLKLKSVQGALWVFEVPKQDMMEELCQIYSPIISHTFAQHNQETITLSFKPLVNTRKKSFDDFKYPFMTATYLEPQHTFNDFVVDENSEFTYSIIKSINNNLNNLQFRNPIYLYGSSGLGKTHLLQAIGHEIQFYQKKMVRYVTAEVFYQDFITSIKDKKISEFTHYYRQKIDILLIDNIQFLAGKKGTLESFLHIFNTLYQHKKQIVIASNCHPNKLENFPDNLISRFQSGIILDIQNPNPELKEAILKKKLEFQNLLIPSEIITYLCHSTPNNIRLLEEIVKQLSIHHSLKKEISLELAKKIIQQMDIQHQAKTPNSKRIIKAVAKHLRVNATKITNPQRGNKDITLARQIAMYVINQLSNSSLKTIGSLFSKEHSTVIYAIKKVKEVINHNPEIKQTLAAILEELDND